jgi:hypothetical protein
MVANFLEHVVIIPAPFLAQNLKDRNTTKPCAIEAARASAAFITSSDVSLT